MLKAGTFFVCALLLGLALLLPRPAAADWPTDPSVNVPLCTATGDQQYPTVVSDGAGGAIVTWYDSRGGITDIYAQRISAGGTVQWTADGVALCTATNAESFSYPAIASEGAGGAIVTWSDARSGNWDIYAQRVNAAGLLQWTAGGVALCTAASDQRSPTIASDGAGGAIVTWQDARSGITDIYAQRVNAAGLLQWTAGGVALCTVSNAQWSPEIVSDGAGGAIVAWIDTGTDDNIFAQRVNAAGVPQWTSNGVALCTAVHDQYGLAIVSDGAGGAIATWQDGRSSTIYLDIYAQRVNAAGVPKWGADGVGLCTAIGSQVAPAIASDGAGGAIVTWSDYRDGFSNSDIFTQRVNAAGVPQWPANGDALCYAAGNQFAFGITSDGAGGAIVTWEDQRSGNWDIYAQRVNAACLRQWTAIGVALCTAAGDQVFPMITLDGAGGAIVTWQDARSGTNADIYAQAVKGNGELGSVLSVPSDASLAFALDPVRPNPTRGGALSVHFSLPTDAPAWLELLDVAGRRIASHEVGAGQHTLDLGAGQHLAPGLYLVRLTQGANTRTRRVAVLK